MKSTIKRMPAHPSSLVYPWLGKCGVQEQQPLHIAMFINEHTGFVVWKSGCSSEVLGAKASSIKNYDHYDGVVEISN